MCVGANGPEPYGLAQGCFCATRRCYARSMDVDVVVVSFNSRGHLRACVEPLAGAEGVHVIVVDNASTDGSLEAIADLPVAAIALDENRGFAYGCNTGWHRGNAKSVAFLNPDAQIDTITLGRLECVLDDRAVGLVAPKLLHADGSVDISQHRFPTLISTYARALFLHRLFPGASWAADDIKEPVAYEAPSSPDWIGGACLLIRRSLLEELGGFDEGFFMYCEDVDLCRRIRDAGLDVRYEPSAVAFHEGGRSTPKGSMLPVFAASRVRYVAKHRGSAAAAVERIGLTLGAVIRMVIGRGGVQVRLGHARSLRTLLVAASPRARVDRNRA
jgi:N-acetylglucosaminyl-diphospho-decaprenol L-rhamnosyltransferase